MHITVDFDLEEGEEEELALILGCKRDELPQKLETHGSCALKEYIAMFLGKKVFRRGSDILEYRLFLLIQNFFNERIPDEQAISNLFQTTASESRSLIRSVMSKYQYQLRDAIDNSIKEILTIAEPQDDKGSVYHVNINSQNLIAVMNTILAKINGGLPAISKKTGCISTYIIDGDSFVELEKYYKQSKNE